MGGKANPGNLWALAPAGSRRPAARTQRLQGLVGAIVPICLILAAAVLVTLPATLAPSARLTLFIFSLVVILWSTTDFNITHVALMAMVLMALGGASRQDQIIEALASDGIWLLIGASILGGAVQQTGLAVRLIQRVVARARTVRGVFLALTIALLPLSLIVPSPAGRSAIVTPIFHNLAQGGAGDLRITRALALLIPAVILVTTIGSLLGAGSHLLAVELLSQIAQQRLSFAAWLLYGLPLAVLASFVTGCWVVHVFLDKPLREQALWAPTTISPTLSRADWKLLGVVTLMIVLWLTESWHGFKMVVVTLAGALVLTCPGIGVLSWKQGVRAVSWDLVVFVGAVLVIGRSLIESGAAHWIIEQVSVYSGAVTSLSSMTILLWLSFFALTAHFYIPAHAARVAALIPIALYLAIGLHLNPVAVVFIATVGLDYCLTLPTSSQAWLIYRVLAGNAYQAADLLRLSALLLPIHVVLIVILYFGYWRWTGLSLEGLG